MIIRLPTTLTLVSLLIWLPVLSLAETSPDTLKADQYLQSAILLTEDGRFDSAVVFYEKALEIYEKAERWDKYVDCHNGAGYSLLYDSRFKEGKELLEKGLFVGMKYLGEDHHEVGEAYLNLGIYYQRMRDLAQTGFHLEKSLEISRSALEEIHPQVAMAYYRTGFHYAFSGDFEKMRLYVQKALDIYREFYGEKHARTALGYGAIGYYFYMKGNYDEALKYTFKELGIYQQVLRADHPDLATAYNNIGMFNYEKGDYPKQLKNLLKSLDVLINNYGPNHDLVGMAYNNIASNYGEKGDYDQQLFYLKKFHDLALAKFGNLHDETAIAYHNLAGCYDQKGDLEKALMYYEKALDINERVKGSIRHLGVLHKDIGNAYVNKQAYERALVHFQKAYETLSNFYGKDHDRVADVLYSQGSVYVQQRDYEKALAYYKEALGIWLRVFGTENPNVANANSGIASVYQAQGNFRMAHTFFQKALNMNLKILEADNSHLAQGHYDLAYNYFLDKKWEQALTGYQRSLVCLAGGFENGDPYVNPDLKNIKSRILFLAILEEKATTFFEKWKAERTGPKVKNRDLEFSLETYQLAIALIDSIRFSFSSEGSQQEFFENSLPIFENALEAAYQLNEITRKSTFLEMAFSITEKSKAFILLQALHDAGAKQFAGIPDSILKIERALKIDLTFYEQTLMRAKQEDDSIKVGLYTEYLFHGKVKYNQLKEQLEKEYPGYFQLKYNTETISLNDVQRRLLDNKTALIEYFVGDSNLFVFLVTSKEYLLYKIERDFPLEPWINQMRKGLYYYQWSGLNGEDIYLAYCDTFAHASSLLYLKLLTPFQSKFPERLIIVPDGLLSYIPFGALLTGPPSENHHFKRHPYLLRDHPISYSYSATLLLEMSTRKNQAPKTLLAFAPVYEESSSLIASVETRRSSLGPLAHTLPEVKGIRALWGGDIFAGSEATEENFIRMAGDYQILHLATHGKANDKMGDDSFLAFTEIKDSIENERLYVKDLYNLKLNAALVVLSACETGIGELQRGEGVISLSRGFSYAGAKSMVTTLWIVNDQHTKGLMQSFYRYLRKGMRKDEALRTAKLDFIHQSSHFDAHPFYWAGFVAQGNMEPVRLSNPVMEFLKFAMIAVMVMFLVFWFYNRRNPSAQSLSKHQLPPETR